MSEFSASTPTPSPEPMQMTCLSCPFLFWPAGEAKKALLGLLGTHRCWGTWGTQKETK